MLRIRISRIIFIVENYFTLICSVSIYSRWIKIQLQHSFIMPAHPMVLPLFPRKYRLACGTIDTFYVPCVIKIAHITRIVSTTNNVWLISLFCIRTWLIRTVACLRYVIHLLSLHMRSWTYAYQRACDAFSLHTHTIRNKCIQRIMKMNIFSNTMSKNLIWA